MRYFYLDISKFARQKTFIPPLDGIFFCQDYINIHHRISRKNFFEISLRLDSGNSICRDIVNNQEISLPFPNCVWKMPMQKFAIRDNAPRDCIAFLWDPAHLPFFSSNGLIPEPAGCHFTINKDIQFMVQKFYRLVNDIYAPGAADKMDWLAMCICREILWSGNNTPAEKTMEQKLNDISVKLKLKCCETVDFSAIARQHGLSTSTFYHEWHNYFQLTPLQFVINCRLETAAELLANTSLPIHQIVEAVNFSGTYAFHCKFISKYGKTPGEFRKQKHSALRE